MLWRRVSLRLTFDHKWLDLARQTQRQISCERDESASVEKTVAFYRQIPSADAKTHREIFAATEKSVSALIDEKHSDSPTNCRLEMRMLGNSDVTKSRNVTVKPSAAVVPATTDNGTECLQQKSW